MKILVGATGQEILERDGQPLIVPAAGYGNVSPGSEPPDVVRGHLTRASP